MTRVKNPNYNPNDPNSKRFVTVNEAGREAEVRANDFNSLFAPFASLASGFKPATPTQFFDASRFQSFQPTQPARPNQTRLPNGATPAPTSGAVNNQPQRPRAEATTSGRNTSINIRTGGGGSIVDELSGRGMASDFGSRAQLAAQAGIQNYQGTAQQNQQLIDFVRGGNVSAGGAPTARPTGGNAQVGGEINVPGVGNVDPDRLSDAELANLARSAGRGGLSFDDYNKILEARGLPTEQESNEIRNRLGIPDLIEDAFSRPERSTVETYRELYDLAGLKDVKNSLKEINDRINKKRDDLVEATGALKNNPWLSQGSRTGRLRILNELAFADISNDLEEKNQLLDLYDQGVDEIEKQIGFAASDRAENRQITVDQLNFLLTEAEREEGLVQRRQVTRGLRNLPDFLAGAEARETAEFNRELSKERAKGGGNVVPQTAAEFKELTEGFIVKPNLTAAEQKTLNTIRNAEGLVDQVEKLYYEAVGDEFEGFGSGVAARTKGVGRAVGGFFGTNQKIEIYQRFLDSNRAPIAKGIKGEAGNLAENEQKNALKSFPSQFSSPAEARAAFSQIRQQILGNKANFGTFVEGGLQPGFGQQVDEPQIDEAGQSVFASTNF